MEKFEEMVENDPKLKREFLLNQQRYDLAEVLRKIRIAKGYSQADVAKIAGLTQQMISKIETYNGNPSFDSFWSYCNAIGVNLLTLIKDKFEGEI